MAETTGIEWCDASYNPWYGCHKVSAGCKNCYMFRDMMRYGRNPSIVTRAAKNTFYAPLKWQKNKRLQLNARIFTCSWSDFFIEEADPWREEVWKIIRDTTFTYLILTKRPERIESCLPIDWGCGYQNVWLGVSVEDQIQTDKRVPLLMKISAAIHFLSCEPLLSEISLSQYFGFPTSPKWVITGGESDLKNPRSCDPNWIRCIRNQCLGAGVSLFHKQNGGTRKIDGSWGGRMIDNQEWAQFPIN